jgi:hypothetical protein
MIYGRSCESLRYFLLMLMDSAEDRNPCQNPAARPHTLAPNAPYTVSQSGDRIPPHTYHADPVRQRQCGTDQTTPLIPHDLDAHKAPRLALQGKTPTPIFLASYPTHIDWAKMPPSPPLTAASSMSTAGICPAPRFFDRFTQDPISPRTFFVACQNQTEVELSITVRSTSCSEFLSPVRIQGADDRCMGLCLTVPETLPS